jgi:hypothetical protein
MPIHVRLPRDEAQALADHVTDALPKLATMYAEHKGALAQIADDLRLDKMRGAEALQKGQALRADTLAKMRETAGDTSALRRELSHLVDSLDLKMLSLDARFLPPIVDGDSVAADRRREAEVAERTLYTRRLRRLTNLRSDGLAEEAQRIARAALPRPDQSPELAKLDILSEFVEALQGDAPEVVRAKTATVAAFAAIDKGWRERADMVAATSSALRNLDHCDELIRAADTGRESTSAQYALHEVRKLRAA